jgi:hypothetical protein
VQILAKSFKDLMNEYEVDKAVDLFKKNYSNFMYRLYKRIDNMLMNHQYNYFATLTLNDNNINIKEKTLIRYSKMFLNDYSEIKDFVCNIDYGSNNNRMHVHCIISSNNKINYSKMISKWKRGAIKNKLIIKKNKYKIGRYITKIGNHAVKSSGNNVFRKKKVYKEISFGLKRANYHIFGNGVKIEKV